MIFPKKKPQFVKLKTELMGEGPNGDDKTGSKRLLKESSDDVTIVLL